MISQVNLIKIGEKLIKNSKKMIILFKFERNCSKDTLYNFNLQINTKKQNKAINLIEKVFY